MIGTIFQKDGFDQEAYSACAQWCNENQTSTIVDKGEYYECVALPPPTSQEIAQARIAELEAYLSATDYMAIKCGELGLSMQQEYPEDYLTRQAARDELNSLRV